MWPAAKEFMAPGLDGGCDARFPVIDRTRAPLFRIQRLICLSISGISVSTLLKILTCCMVLDRQTGIVEKGKDDGFLASRGVNFHGVRHRLASPSNGI